MSPIMMRGVYTEDELSVHDGKCNCIGCLRTEQVQPLGGDVPCQGWFDHLTGPVLCQSPVMLF